MSPVEAMTILMRVADGVRTTLEAIHPNDPVQKEDIELAQAVITAMLNTALPVARFRCFVSVDIDSKKKSPVRREFTVCAPDIAGIQGGIVGLQAYQTDVHVTLWEQRAGGAEMVSGFQGPSKTQQYRRWLSSLTQHEGPVTTQ